MLNPVVYLRLFLASGAFCTNLVQSLYVECDKWRLGYKQKYVDLLYTFKISSMIRHPFKSVINDRSTSQLLLDRPSLSAPLSLGVRKEASELSVSFWETFKTFYWPFTTMAAPRYVVQFVF